MMIRHKQTDNKIKAKNKKKLQSEYLKNEVDSLSSVMQLNTQNTQHDDSINKSQTIKHGETK